MKRILMFLLCLMLLSGCAGMKEPEPGTEPTVPVTEAVTGAPTQVPTEATACPTVIGPTEPAVLPEPGDEEIVRILDYLPAVREDLAYAGTENFTGQQIYHFYNAYLRYGTVKKLAAVSEELAGEGLGLLIWDGFHPVSAQEKLWEICPDEKYVSHPVTGSRSHCRGSAVDLTLFDLETGEILEMPTGFDDFSALADRDYSDCTDTAAANAQKLEDVMTKHGFKGYWAEWWHYSDTDTYPVDEVFEPPVG